MHEAKITISEELEARFRVCVKIGLIEEGAATAYDI
jgi:hypothetical protein